MLSEIELLFYIGLFPREYILPNEYPRHICPHIANSHLKLSIFAPFIIFMPTRVNQQILRTRTHCLYHYENNMKFNYWSRKSPSKIRRYIRFMIFSYNQLLSNVPMYDIFILKKEQKCEYTKAVMYTTLIASL